MTLDIVVVGAGLAGLRAADVVTAAGASVVVLEASGRVGGRVRSHHFSNGQWCERGAEFVDSTHSEVLDLVQRFGLGLLSARTGADPRTRLLDIAGRVSSFADQPSMLDDLRRWGIAKADLANSIDVHDLTSPGARRLDHQSAAEFVASLNLSLYARVVVGRELRTEFMVPPEEISLLHLAWMSALEGQTDGGHEAFRVRGGNDQLANGLAAGLADRVRLSSPVASVDASSGAVRTKAGEVFAGDAVVLAVPPSVLARIDVSPALPTEIASIGWGIGAKVSTQYARRLWIDEGGDGSVCSERAYGELWETTGGQPGDTGVLTALLSSNDGAALAALPDAEQRIRGEVSRVFPGSGALAGESIATNWTNEPYALGCYAAFAPGQITRILPLLTQRYRRVVLAGEHTDTHAGFMEGALRSGVRAAYQALTQPSGQAWDSA